MASTTDDWQAARELASEMTMPESAKFLRSERGYSLMEGIYESESIGCQFPASRLADDLRSRGKGPSPSPLAAEGKSE